MGEVKRELEKEAVVGESLGRAKRNFTLIDCVNERGWSHVLAWVPFDWQNDWGR